jgi:hypothetical protein
MSCFKSLAALCVGLAFGLSCQAQAAKDGPDPWAAPELRRHMACLQKSLADSLDVPAAAASAPQLLRARLVFRAGEAEPSLDWLWAGDPEAADRLAPQLRAYRLPCLEAGESPAAIVQEFWWTPGTGRLEAGEILPTSAPGLPMRASCYQAPSAKFASSEEPTELSKLLLYFRFTDGEAEPEVVIAHHVGSSAFVADVRRYVRGYKPCADGKTTTGTWHEQTYVQQPRGVARPRLRPLELSEFLARVRRVSGQQGHFDTRTMNCPFKVALELRQPAQANRATSVGPADPNRTVFLEWMGRQQMNFSAGFEAQVFLETLTITVPCQVLDLENHG